MHDMTLFLPVFGPQCLDFNTVRNSGFTIKFTLTAGCKRLTGKQTGRMTAAIYNSRCFGSLTPQTGIKAETKLSNMTAVRPISQHIAAPGYKLAEPD